MNNQEGNENDDLEISLEVFHDDDFGGKEEPSKTPKKDEEEESEEKEEETAEEEAAEEEEEQQEEESEVEPVKVTLSENGDLTDENGKVILKKGEFELDENGQPKLTEEQVDLITNPPTFIEEALTDLDYKPTDEDGNPKIYEPTKEGITELVQDAATSAADSAVNGFFSAPENKETLAYHNFIAQGGKKEDYFKERLQWKDITIADDADDDTLTAMATKLLTAEGHSEEDAKDLIGVWQDKSILKDRVKASLEKRQAKVAEDEAAQESARLEAEAKAKDDSKKYWNGIQTIVNEGKLSDGLKINDDNKDEFFLYVAQPVKDGLTQDALDSGKETVSDALTLSYLRFLKNKKGIDLKTLIANEAKALKTPAARKKSVKVVDASKARPKVVVVSNDTSDIPDIASL